jgi:hypothetical protein
MMLETIRIVTDWVQDATDGVNANLDTIDYDGSDTAPDDVAYFGDDTRDEIVALRKDPPKYPAIYVTEDAPWTMEGEVNTICRRAEDITIAIRYLIRAHDRYSGRRDTYYTLRAVVASVKELMDNANLASRTRDNVCIESAESISQLIVHEAVGEATVTGAVVVTFRVIDTAP